MASFLKLSVPPQLDFRSAILNAGYRVSLSHCYPHSIKTDAPPSVVWDLFSGVAKRQYPDRTWPKPLPEKPSPTDYLLSRQVSVVADFTTHPDANPESKKLKLVRFQANPEKNWGPKSKAKSRLLLYSLFACFGDWQFIKFYVTVLKLNQKKKGSLTRRSHGWMKRSHSGKIWIQRHLHFTLLELLFTLARLMSIICLVGAEWTGCLEPSGLRAWRESLRVPNPQRPGWWMLRMQFANIPVHQL